MCTRVEIEYPNSRALCGTVGELMAQVGKKIQFFPGFTEIVDEHYCLCPVDLAETAKSLGYHCIRANTPGRLLPGDVIFRPIPDAPAQTRRSKRHPKS